MANPLCELEHRGWLELWALEITKAGHVQDVGVSGWRWLLAPVQCVQVAVHNVQEYARAPIERLIQAATRILGGATMITRNATALV